MIVNNGIKAMDIAELVKAPAARAMNLCSISGTRTAGESQLHQAVLCYSHKQNKINNNKQNKINNNNTPKTLTG